MTTTEGDLYRCSERLLCAFDDLQQARVLLDFDSHEKWNKKLIKLTIGIENLYDEVNNYLKERKENV